VTRRSPTEIAEVATIMEEAITAIGNGMIPSFACVGLLADPGTWTVAHYAMLFMLPMKWGEMLVDLLFGEVMAPPRIRDQNGSIKTFLNVRSTGKSNSTARERRAIGSGCRHIPRYTESAKVKVEMPVLLRRCPIHFPHTLCLYSVPTYRCYKLL
jgi:hypothetical protein